MAAGFRAPALRDFGYAELGRDARMSDARAAGKLQFHSATEQEAFRRAMLRYQNRKFSAHPS